MNPDYLILYHESKLGIRFFEFVLLVLIEQRQYDTLEECYQEEGILFIQMIESLEKEGYVKWHGTKTADISLRKKAEDVFIKITKNKSKGAVSDVNLWFDEWRNLFPEGVNNGGFRYRGNRLEGLKKMIKFVSLNPYSKEEIFEATKKYVERFAQKGYMYMLLAHYFIEKKDTGSTLESECETLRETGSKPVETPNYGRNVK
jgi:hypothetical protein